MWLAEGGRGKKMARLIDGDALIELINGGYDLDFNEVPETKRELLRMIMEQPTVDAVPVVRCKDCKYSVDEYDDGECYCDYENDLRYIKDWNHHCSWAERKEENG